MIDYYQIPPQELGAGAKIPLRVMENSDAVYLMRIYANQGEYELREDFRKKTENVWTSILRIIAIVIDYNHYSSFFTL